MMKIAFIICFLSQFIVIWCAELPGFQELWQDFDEIHVQICCHDPKKEERNTAIWFKWGQFFSKYLQETTHSLWPETRYGVFFCELKTWSIHYVSHCNTHSIFMFWIENCPIFKVKILNVDIENNL